jgi:EAL domain-containing protein (putative c-di-GMP-specific phosphodiesterase class I)
MVSTIINLAHALKLKVVAEGVETEEQSRLLRLLGCTKCRAYYSANRAGRNLRNNNIWPGCRGVTKSELLAARARSSRTTSAPC